MKRMMMLCVLFMVLSVGCARAPVKNLSEAMRPGASPPLTDDENFETLKAGIELQIKYWKAKPVNENIQFGDRSVSVETYLSALRKLQDAENKAEFFERVQALFEFHEVYGGERWGEVFVTGYYEPQINGSLRPHSQFTQPLYKLPPDLVNINVSEFARVLPHWSLFAESYTRSNTPPSFLRGRYQASTAKDQPAQILPYYSRKEIDSEGALKSRNLEIVYVDPIDAFFLQIQGSGQVSLENKKVLRLGYASQNGHPYVAVGKFLTDVIDKENMSKQSIESYMRTEMSVEERQALMNQNPSFVFFRPLDGRPLTASGTEVIPHRTIATDWTYFPKGTLAFLQFQKPGAAGLVEASRLVFDQDTGGAIKGTGRVDLFCGTGADAEQIAGHMRHHGKLWYLVPKDNHQP